MLFEKKDSIYFFSSVLIAGKSITSLILVHPVNNITNLSIPIPTPPVGGIPCSTAWRKSSSMGWASSSPNSDNFSCDSNLALWSIGSFNSENALANSAPPINSSNLSTKSGSLFLWFLLRGRWLLDNQLQKSAQLN